MTNTTISRRTFTYLGLTLIATTALTACGGGGSSDGDTSSKVNLRKAFEEIQYGMTKDEVRAVVGRHEDDESSFYWSEGSEELLVTTSTDDKNTARATRVRWFLGTTGLDRDLTRGE